MCFSRMKCGHDRGLVWTPTVIKYLTKKSLLLLPALSWLTISCFNRQEVFMGDELVNECWQTSTEWWELRSVIFTGEVKCCWKGIQTDFVLEQNKYLFEFYKRLDWKLNLHGAHAWVDSQVFIYIFSQANATSRHMTRCRTDQLWLVFITLGRQLGIFIFLTYFSVILWWHHNDQATNCKWGGWFLPATGL